MATAMTQVAIFQPRATGARVITVAARNEESAWPEGNEKLAGAAMRSI